MNQSELTVVSVYNRYLNRGGEDEVFEAEARLLQQHGNKVISVIEQTRKPKGSKEKIRLAMNALWSKQWFEKFLTLLRGESIDLVHVHNFFPIMSPSIYYACNKARIPLVQTLHNYRFLCPTATFYRNGHVCEDCLGKTPPWPGIVYACYHGSRAQTAVVAAMLTIHRWLKTWQKQVDVYVALTEFSRQKFIQGGLPAEKIMVKPNFVIPDPGVREDRGVYALFIARHSLEKGVRTLLSAWSSLRDIPLKVVGDGPLLNESRAIIQQNGLQQTVHFLGRLPHQEVIALIKGARFLVAPYESYENFPLTIAETFACGTPVIASRRGAMAEIVEDGRTGLHFTPGDPDDLVEKAKGLWSRPEEADRMGRETRAEYQSKYTEERNYQMLMKIYQAALSRAQCR